MRTATLARRVRVRLTAPLLATLAGAAIVGSGLDHTVFLRALHQAPVDSISSVTTPVVVNNEVAIVAISTGDVQPPAASTTKSPSLNVDAVNNAHIDQWVSRLTTTLKRDFQTSLDRMGKYAEMIATKLDKRQMPKDLVYLAMIESNFNPEAKSPVRAVGLWQFMSSTAKRFGLSVGGKVDERKDPEKSTDAALTYLSKLHDRFGSWYLAAAAYNSGEGTVSRALKKVTGKTTGTDEDFFRILSALPRETQQYVPKLIASARVGNNAGRYGLSAE